MANFAQFSSTISGEKIQDHEIMVSFDVESLFINVPIEGAVEAARQRSASDPSLANRTTLAPAQIANLLDFVRTCASKERVRPLGKQGLA